MDIALISLDTMPHRSCPTSVRPTSAPGTRALRARLAPLWLVLAAFLGHTTMPPAIWGALDPRESEHESDTLEEIWKWAAVASRGAPHGRKQRRAGLHWAPPRDARGGQNRQAALRVDGQLHSGEWSAWNGLGSPLRL